MRKSRNIDKYLQKSGIPRKSQGRFLTPHENQEPNGGRFLTPKKEPRKEPRKVLDSKTGTKNRTEFEKLAPPVYKCVSNCSMVGQ